MNTNSELDRIVRNWLEDRVADPPHGSLEAALDRVGQTPQQHRRWLQWWFGRGGGVTASAAVHGRDDPSIYRRYRLVFSTTAVAATVAVLVLVSTLTTPHQTVEPDALTITGDTTLSVAADGSGDFSTIGEAVAAAEDGETVLLEPGVYEEAFLIDRDITVAGNGESPSSVVIIVPEGAPGPAVPITPNDPRGDGFELHTGPSVGIQLIDTDATVRNLQIIGGRHDLDMLVSGGAPVLEDLVLRHDESVELNASFAGGLFIDGGSSATVERSSIWHRTRVSGSSAPLFSESYFVSARISIQDGSKPVIVDSSIQGNCGDSAVAVIGGSDATFRGNTLDRAEVTVQGAIDDDTRAYIEDNQFTSSDLVALTVKDGASATIEGNAFARALQAVNVSHATATIRGNSFFNNINAMTLSNATAEVADNLVRGGDYGVSVVFAGAPVITGNTIADATMRGIMVGGGTSPTVDGNTVCGSAVNLYIQPSANPDVGDNDICPDKADA